ncbi:MAG TPA: 6-carboxytetrahydropterin synthase [candidate division WOR-3 bacterium]|uniref:6-carboxy-5,6,7,8-tetrahydropterin synthase n=1 Tax=candidate division WOR-3 bacterium TaxID=2052148 RepID=A0A7V0T5S9_UNCW3|nr:6-carboxytetrahydropterin synthase [candidate division WOR-3 bacterium]
MYTIRVSRRFSAAHRIQGRGGKCENIHGHNYRVEVFICAEQLAPPGMVADFIEVRERLDTILPDHQDLNAVYDFNPTAENLTRRFFEELAEFYPVRRVVVWENDDSAAEYEPA